MTIKMFCFLTLTCHSKLRFLSCAAGHVGKDGDDRQRWEDVQCDGLEDRVGHRAPGPLHPNSQPVHRHGAHSDASEECERTAVSHQCQ